MSTTRRGSVTGGMLHVATSTTGGDSPVEVLVEHLQKRSRLEMMEKLRRFITMDNHEAVKNGNLEKTQDSLPVLKPKFTADFPEAVVREGADELILRREGEEGYVAALSSTPRKWETVDGGHRSWMRTGTPSVRPFSKGRHGRTCTASTWRCTMLSI